MTLAPTPRPLHVADPEKTTPTEDLVGSIRDAIFAADDIDLEIVDVPEWGVTIALKSLTGVQRSALMDQTLNDDGEVNRERAYRWMNALLVIACAHDPETGTPIFTIEDMEALGEKSAAVVTRLGEQCSRLVGFAPEALEEAKKSAAPES